MQAFLLAPESPRPIGVVRILAGFALFLDAVLHWRYAVELYSEAGSPMPMFAGMGLVPPSLSAEAAVLFSTLLIGTLWCVVLGWQTRTSLCIALVLSTWLGLLDATGTFKKYSVVGFHLLLLLSLTRCGAAWSIDRCLNPQRAMSLSPAWPRRLLQLLLCSIYWGAAFTKIKVVDFASGDLLLFSLLDQRWGGGWLAQWLTMHQELLILASMGTILFEFLFPLLVWVPKIRPWAVGMGIGFHLSLDLFLNIGIFGLVMVALLCSFLEESDLRWWGSRLETISQRWGLSQRFRRWIPSLHPIQRLWISPVIWGGMLAVVVTVGMGWQYTMDWYHVFHRPRFKQFVELEPETVQPILSETPLSARAYFHDLAIGSRSSGSNVYGNPEELRPGMNLYLIARLSVPHPALRVRVTMTAPGDAAFTHEDSIDRVATHMVIPFRMQQDFPRGSYRLEVETALAGEDNWVSVRTFRFRLRE